MTDRLKIIFSALPPCKTFADVGCDHGYIAKAMMDFNKCEKAIISDVSAKCLVKAETLLNEYISAGKVTAVVSDGFDKIGVSDLALIAGMGGEEICSIITRAKNLPKMLALQPMKNCSKVRKVAVELGYKIIKDFLFKSAGKFYDFILLEKGEDFLTEDELFFGRDNIKGENPAFIESLKIRKEKLLDYLKNDAINSEERAKLSLELERVKKHV